MSEKREQRYAEPQAYFDDDKQTLARNAAADRTELDRLRTAVKEADAVAAKASDWTERTRAEGHAKSLARELQAVEFNARLVQAGAPTPQQAGQAACQPGFVVSDCGGAYLFVENTGKRATRAPRAAAGVGTQMFAEPTLPGE